MKHDSAEAAKDANDCWLNERMTGYLNGNPDKSKKE